MPAELRPPTLARPFFCRAVGLVPLFNMVIFPALYSLPSWLSWLRPNPLRQSEWRRDGPGHVDCRGCIVHWHNSRVNQSQWLSVCNWRH